jgi:hypothetical protein
MFLRENLHFIWVLVLEAKIDKTNSVALGPQANYTDWATATYRRNLVPTFVDTGVSRGQSGGSLTVVNLNFLDRSNYFSFKYLLIYRHKGWVDPVPDPLLFRKSLSAGNRTRDLWVYSQELWPLEHRGGLSATKHSLIIHWLNLLGHDNHKYLSFLAEHLRNIHSDERMDFSLMNRLTFC